MAQSAAGKSARRQNSRRDKVAAMIAEADDPTTSPERLREIWQEIGITSAACNSRIARHPNTPLDLLPALIQYSPKGVLANPILPLLPLERPDLFETCWHRDLVEMLRSASAPPAFVAHLVPHRSEDVAEAARYHVALPKDHPSRPADLEERWREIGEARFLSLPLRDPLSPEELAWFGEEADWLRRWTDANQEYLESLTGDTAHDPLSFVDPYDVQEAANPATTGERLTALLAESQRSPVLSWIVSTIAGNVNAPPDLLRAILVAHPECAYPLAQNPALPSDILLTLAANRRNVTRLRVLKHPAVQSDAKLAEQVRMTAYRYVTETGGFQVNRRGHETPFVADVLTAWCLPDATALRKLAASGDWLVRYGVARNPATSAAIVRRLAKTDGCRLVRAAAQAGLDVRRSARRKKPRSATV